MREIQAGDGEAFAVLYQRLAPTALRITRELVHGEIGRAHEAMQEGFLSIWRSRRLYRPELGSVESWAFTVVRNRALDAIRRHARHDHHRDHLGGSIDIFPCLEPGAQEQALADDEAARLRELLLELPAAQREVITLAYFAGLTHAEIAQRLDLPLGTIKGRMRLGFDKLREHAVASPEGP